MTSHPPNRINDLTREEIAFYLEKSKKVRKCCLVCDRVVWMVPGQIFCSDRCRAAHQRASARMAYEQLLRDRDRWYAERDGYIKEIAELRAELLNLKLKDE